MVENEFWETIPSIIAAISSFALALFLLYRNGVSVRGALLVSAAVAVASVAIQQAAGWTVLGTVLGLSNGLYLGPALIAVWREYAPVGSVARHVVADRVGGPESGASTECWWPRSRSWCTGRLRSCWAAGVLLRLRMTRHRIQAALGRTA